VTRAIPRFPFELLRVSALQIGYTSRFRS
jgi:hypothetical protein